METTDTIPASASASASEAETAPEPVPVVAPAPEPEPEPEKADVDIDSIKDKILAIVSEKTGYPSDMLDLDLDLEADLGIDTVKQAEMFSEIRAAFGIPKQDDLKLSDYPTLNHVIKFAQDKMGTPPEPEPEEETAHAHAHADAHVDVDGVKDKILAIVSEKTGYPTDMLDLDLDLEADLGIDTVKQAEMFSEIRAAFGIPKQDDLKLSDYPTLNHVIKFAQDKMGADVVSASVSVSVSEDEDDHDQDHDHENVDVASVKDKILAIVSEKTGYPTDMLDLDLDLEADLGIDTVKQAEMFSEIRAAFGIPKQDDLKLSDYPTLNHVIQFAKDKMGTPPEPEPQEEIAHAHAHADAHVDVDGDGVKDKILAIVSEKTGYPTDMLDLDLDLEADLGIDTVKQAEMFSEIRAAFGIPKQEDLKLSDYPTLNHVIQFAQDKMGAAPTEEEPEEEEAPAVEPLGSCGRGAGEGVAGARWGSGSDQRFRGAG
jgi:acyl carrier protein